MNDGFCDESCAGPPPEELRRGIEEFNRGEWFDCHETLEELWAGEQRAVRSLYQGVLQVAVALHHWREGNYRGALFLLDSAARLLDQVAPVCRGVDAAALAESARKIHETLVHLGAERMEELDRSLIPRISLADSPR
ncbi:DUF309 domain-containing protein [Geobacter pickeringii]|uniref:DUF309 domain-containing protein n=1 Tax=Geobacter pickeringii TaxID=345632 RepID=A0A0B5B8C7_9BACT|nr:DUF309 domain-containing protein [Geobacter pickeringii]AJE02812.1 hypothetical protein GPICK_05025 [Geobacter pickeringii]